MLSEVSVWPMSYQIPLKGRGLWPACHLGRIEMIWLYFFGALMGSVFIYLYRVFLIFFELSLYLNYSVFFFGIKQLQLNITGGNVQLYHFNFTSSSSTSHLSSSLFILNTHTHAHTHWGLYLIWGWSPLFCSTQSFWLIFSLNNRPAVLSPQSTQIHAHTHAHTFAQLHI